MSDDGGRPHAVVMGLGLFGGGAAAARYLFARGFRVTVTDLRDRGDLAPAIDELSDLEIEWVLGRHRVEDFERARCVVANPAVRRDHPLLDCARAHGARIRSEVGLFLEQVPGPVLGVSGTQGKSSTVHLCAGILAAAGQPARPLGNIGRPGLAELDALTPDEVVVIELSSYQLESLPEELAQSARPRPLAAAAITNVLADHLERHGSLEAYRAAKGRLLELVAPGGEAWLGPGAHELSAPPDVVRRLVPAKAPGLRVEGGAFRLGGQVLAPLEALHLPGKFQRDNALLALALAKGAGAATQRLGDALATVQGLPHRFEPLGTVEGRSVWDNGVSTTPDSTIAALAALPRGTVLLCGGRPKALATEGLFEAAAKRCARVVVFGEAAQTWPAGFAAAGCPAEAEPDLTRATRLALARTPEGAALLFSPAAASFDAFANFAARARAFRGALGRISPPAAPAAPGAPASGSAGAKGSPADPC